MDLSGKQQSTSRKLSRVVIRTSDPNLGGVAEPTGKTRRRVEHLGSPGRRTPDACRRGPGTAAPAAGGACAGVAEEIGPATVARAVAREFSLAPRETEVLVAATSGKCTKEIAVELGICGKTVEYFWACIFRRTHCLSQGEVMALLLRHACGRRPGRA